MVDDLVPRRAARVVWCDDGEGVAARAAARLSALGYTDVARRSTAASTPGRARAFALYSGIHVPSKAFAEVVEHEAKTPYISVHELQAMLDAKADIVIYDSRSLRGISQQLDPDRDQRARRRTGLSLCRSGAEARNPGRRQLRRPHAQHHRRAVADCRRRRQPRRLAEGRHHGLASRRPRGGERRDAASARGHARKGCAWAQAAAAKVTAQLRHRPHRSRHARGLARRGRGAHALPARRAHAGRIRKRPPARRALGARRPARAGDRLPPRRPGARASCWSRQRRARHA